MYMCGYVYACVCIWICVRGNTCVWAYLWVSVWVCRCGWVHVDTPGAPVGANPNDPQTSVQPKPLFTKDGRLEPSSTIIGSETTIHDGVLVMNVISLPNKDLTSDCKNQIIL